MGSQFGGVEVKIGDARINARQAGVLRVVSHVVFGCCASECTLRDWHGLPAENPEGL